MPVKETVVWNLIIKKCLDCGDLDMGERLFHEMPMRVIAAWNAMIHGALNQHRRNDEALVPFKQLVGYGVQGTPNTYSCVITACASALGLGLGARIDGHVIKLN
ncbi:hypothetical protein RJ639_043879 [Escallonia herrerae]|uniref:Pentatricopeptide repeat-containing protein n=1 Tax=Escallonia herrerae TaxID=1293975 RepID=A0AA89B7J9_9ASTE|nr:hypothetical protein RJ639_043879 [Escallonia herrerae]